MTTAIKPPTAKEIQEANERWLAKSRAEDQELRDNGFTPIITVEQRADAMKREALAKIQEAIASGDPAEYLAANEGKSPVVSLGWPWEHGK